MRYRLWALLCLFWTAPALADSPSAQALLAEMASAQHDRDYSGRLVYMRGSELNTLEFLHAHFDGQEFERLTHLDGQQAQVIRHAGQLVCVHADKTITRLSGRAGVGPFVLQAQLVSDIPRQYEVMVVGPGRVAGRDAWQLDVIPVDSFRYGYRLWIDHASRLMLRSEMIDLQGQALERLEFIELDLDTPLARHQFALPSALPEQALEPVQADSHPHGRLLLETGWVPDGFVAAADDLRMASGDKAPVKAFSYSDGLAAFTLFVERASGEVGAMHASRGPTLAMSRQLPGGQGDWLVTLVGEVPVQTAERVLQHVAVQDVP